MGTHNERMEVLDAMRGVAALLVVLFHIRLVVPGVPGGYLAVDFFFALSGLVIAQTYGKRLSSDMSFAEFAVIRGIRMYPLFALGLAIAVARALGQLALSQPDALAPAPLAVSVAFELFMLPSPADRSLFPLNSPAWSLFFEVLVNLLFAMAMLRASTRILTGFVAVGALGLMAAAFSVGSLGTGYNWDSIHWGLARVCFSFTVGVLICRLELHRRMRLGGYWFAAPIMALVAALVVAPSPPYRALYDACVVLLLCPALVVFGAACTPKPWFRSTARTLGDTSYAIYAVHYPLLFMFAFTMRRLQISPMVWLPVFLALMVALAALLNRYYDEPVRRWLRQRLLLRSRLVAGVA